MPFINIKLFATHIINDAFGSGLVLVRIEIHFLKDAGGCLAALIRLIGVFRETLFLEIHIIDLNPVFISLTIVSVTSRHF